MRTTRGHACRQMHGFAMREPRTTFPTRILAGVHLMVSEDDNHSSRHWRFLRLQACIVQPSSVATRGPLVATMPRFELLYDLAYTIGSLFNGWIFGSTLTKAFPQVYHAAGSAAGVRVPYTAFERMRAAHN